MNARLSPKQHWLGDDGSDIAITISGGLLEWKYLQEPDPCDTGRTKGAKVQGFSDDSRRRLMRLLARIDWRKTGKSTFLTLTYPDPCKRESPKAYSQDRSVFWRYLESHTENHVSAIWRTEWKVRQSGARTGELMPHLHLMIFRAPWIDKDDIADWWGKSLQYPGTPRTRIELMDNEKQAGSYVAKYCGKPEDCGLVNTVYLNSMVGRAWGILRRKNLPLHPELAIRITPSANVARVLSILAGISKYVSPGERRSFTLYGEVAHKAKELLEKWGIDGWEVIE